MISGSFYTNDGGFVAIRNTDDFARIIETKLGYDAAQMFRELAEKATREAARADSDLASYESQLDELQAAIKELERKPHTLISISNKRYLSKVDKRELRQLAEAIRGLLDLAS